MTSSLRARVWCVRAMTMNPQRRREKKESRERDERATPSAKKTKKRSSFLQKNCLGFKKNGKLENDTRQNQPHSLHSVRIHSQKASDIASISISRTHARIIIIIIIMSKSCAGMLEEMLKCAEQSKCYLSRSRSRSRSRRENSNSEEGGGNDDDALEFCVNALMRTTTTTNDDDDDDDDDENKIRIIIIRIRIK